MLLHCLCCWSRSRGNIRFILAGYTLGRVRARSSSRGTPQKGHEDQAARLAGGDPGFAIGTAGRDRHARRAAKEDLPADTFVDFEQGLNNAMKRLRAALDDDAESPRFIETLPRRGDRFIGPVRGSEPTPQLSPAMIKPGQPLPTWRRSATSRANSSSHITTCWAKGTC